MPVRYTDVPIPMSGGLDTKTNSQVLRPPALSICENATYEQNVGIGKRPGARDQDPAVKGADALTSCDGIVVRKGELMVFDSGKAYSRSTTIDKWVDQGEFVPVVPTSRAAAQTASEQTAADMATAGGITVYAWDDSRGTVRYSVEEELTGTLLVQDQSVAADTEKPRVIALGQFVFIVYLDTANQLLKSARVPVSDPGTLVHETLFSDIHTTAPHYDIQPAGGAAVWVCRTDDPDTALGFMTASGELGGPSNGYPTSILAGRDCLHACAVGYDVGTDSYCVAYAHGDLQPDNLDMYCEFFTAGLISKGAPTEFVNNQLTTVSKNVTVGYYASGQGYILWDAAVGSTGADLFRQGITESATTGSADLFLVNTRLASHSFVRDEKLIFLTMFEDEDAIQETYFLVRHDGLIIAKALYGLAAIPTDANMGGPSALSSTVISIAAVFKGRLALLEVDTSDTQYTDKGVERIDFDFDPELSAVQNGRTAYLAAGYLYGLDGGFPAEAGFHYFPSKAAANVGGLTGGLEVSQTYAYRCYFETRNRQGELVRSTFGYSTSVTMTGSTKEASLSCAAYGHTHHSSTLLGDISPGRNEVSIVWYRTEKNPANGALYYRVSDPSPANSGLSENNYVLNDPTAQTTIVMLDQMTDAVLITKELDPESRARVDATPAPVGSVIAEGKDRVFVAGLRDPLEIRYSLTRDAGRMIEFNDKNFLRVDEDGGPIVAMLVLHELVAVFKETAIYGFAGDGRHNVGGLGLFTKPQLLTADVGCVNPQAIVMSPVGAVFQSAKGFRLLAQNGQVLPIGEPVFAFQDQRFAGGVLVEDRNEIIFFPSGFNLDGTATTTQRSVVYNYVRRRWSVNTGQGNVVGAVKWLGRTTYAQSNGTVRKEDPAWWRDGQDPYRLKLRLAPFYLSGPQDWFSCRKVAILGKFKSAHKLKIRAGYNAEESWVDEWEFDPSTVINVASFGDDAAFGDSENFGGDNNPVYEFDVLMRRRAMQSFFLEFEDVPGDSPGESYSLTVLTPEVGAIPGSDRRSAKHKVG